MEELERRLRLNDTVSEEKVQTRLEGAKEDNKHSEIEGFYERVIINDDLTKTASELEQYLFANSVEDVLPDATGEESVPSTEVIEGMDGDTVKAEDITAPDVVDVPTI